MARSDTLHRNPLFSTSIQEMSVLDKNGNVDPKKVAKLKKAMNKQAAQKGQVFESLKKAVQLAESLLPPKPSK